MSLSVLAGPESFQVTQERTSINIPWPAVCEATVLKFDRYTVDEIGMLILCDEPFGLVQLSEHTPGFQAFADALHAALPSSVPYAEWYLAVIFPAFETNARCIYRRGGVPDAAPPAMPPDDGVPQATTEMGRFRRWIRIITGV